MESTTTHNGQGHSHINKRLTHFHTEHSPVTFDGVFGGSESLAVVAELCCCPLVDERRPHSEGAKHRFSAEKITRLKSVTAHWLHFCNP